MPARATWCDGWPVRSVPPSVTEPRRGAMMPITLFTVVDLPMPLRPMSVATSPSCTSMLMPKRAWLGP